MHLYGYLAVCTVLLVLLYFVRKKSQEKKRRITAKPGTVVLHQLSPTRLVVNGSPPCLKLETFLRMAKIPYECDYSLTFSKKGKMPWIAFNGLEIADSNFSIQFLSKEFNVDIDSHLTLTERAIGHCVRTMLEENSYCELCFDQKTLAGYRVKHFGEVQKDDVHLVMGRSTHQIIHELKISWVAHDRPCWNPGWRCEMMMFSMRGILYYRWFTEYVDIMREQLFGNLLLPMKYLMVYMIQRKCKRDLWSHGIGRHSEEELFGIVKKDLLAVSNILGQKKFLFGEKPCLADVASFAFIVSGCWDCPESPFADLIRSELQNLDKHARRMKELYYPDWDEIISKKAKVA